MPEPYYNPSILDNINAYHHGTLPLTNRLDTQHHSGLTKLLEQLATTNKLGFYNPPTTGTTNPKIIIIATTQKRHNNLSNFYLDLANQTLAVNARIGIFAQHGHGTYDRIIINDTTPPIAIKPHNKPTTTYRPEYLDGLTTRVLAELATCGHHIEFTTPDHLNKRKETYKQTIILANKNNNILYTHCREFLEATIEDINQYTFQRAKQYLKQPHRTALCTLPIPYVFLNHFHNKTQKASMQTITLLPQP